MGNLARHWVKGKGGIEVSILRMKERKGLGTGKRGGGWGRGGPMWPSHHPEDHLPVANLICRDELL